MTALLAADLHLTSNPAEEERWGIFPWFADQIKRHDCSELFILGDGTEAKDRHDARLVNRLVDNVSRLLDRKDLTIYWLRGNHDGLDPQLPFFNFLNQLPGFSFVTTPTSITCTLGKVLLLPNTAHWEEDWAGLNFSDYDYLMAHQTFSGSVSETGYLMEKGIPPTTLDAVRYKAYSGDIHQPQTFGKKGEYIGAPYRTRYGDKYEGRCLIVSRGPKGRHLQQELHYPTKGKHVVEIRELDDLDHYSVPEGGNVKVRVRVSRGDLPGWKDTKAKVLEEAAKRGWAVKDVELVRTEVGGAETGKVEVGRGSAWITSSLKRSRSAFVTFEDYCARKKSPALVRDIGSNILKVLGAR